MSNFNGSIQHVLFDIDHFILRRFFFLKMTSEDWQELKDFEIKCIQDEQLSKLKQESK